MATLLEDLIEWIIDAGHATVAGVDIFENYEPEMPNKCIMLHSYDSVLSTDKGNEASLRFVQVVARDTGSSGAQQLAQQLFELFFRPDEEITDLPNNRWALVFPRQVPFKLKEDHERRVYWVFNVSITTNIN
jgi:hypothetical protein